MKKKKLTFLFSIATLCLCFSILAFGVYAAKKASLTTTGSVSFEAHNCKVAVVATIQNAMRSKELDYAVVDDKTYTNQGNSSDQTWKDKFDKGYEDDEQTLKILNNSDSWNFGDIFFDDWNIGNDEEIQPISITFTITNYSDYPVKASFKIPALGSNLSASDSVNEVYIDKKPAEGSALSDELVLKISINDESQNVSLQNLNLTVNFEKSKMPIIPLASDFGSVSGSTLYLQTLTLDENNEIVIPSKVKDSSGNTVVIDTIYPYTGYSTVKGKMIISEGITTINSNYTTLSAYTVVLPSTFESYISNRGSSVYEIYNNSSVQITKGSGIAANAIAVHDDPNEESIVKVTNDGITYLVDTDNTTSKVISINNSTSSITLPEKLSEYNYTLPYGGMINVTNKIYVDSNNTTYASNGDVLYDKTTGQYVWTSGAETITIPAGVNSITIASTTTTVNVEEGNTTYGSNGDVLYKKTTGGIVWTSGAETITIPADVTNIYIDNYGGDIKLTTTTVNVEEGNTTYASNGDVLYNKTTGDVIWTSGAATITIPADVTNIATSKIKSTTTAINVAEGNTTYSIKNNALFNGNLYVWSNNYEYTVEEDDTNSVFANTSIKKVVFDCDYTLTYSYAGYPSMMVTTLFKGCSSLEMIVFNVSNSSVKEEIKCTGIGGYRSLNYVNIYIKENITDMDEALSTKYTKQETSSLDGYAQWNPINNSETVTS